jgi:hypothetical protein
MKSADEIAVFLKMKDRPSSEAELLRFASGLDRLPPVQNELFLIHFELYHRLYLIRETHGPEGWYLHSDPMRIRLIRLPDGCCYYFQSTGMFCGEGTTSRCVAHPHRENPAIPLFDPLREFYLNMENAGYWNDPVFQKSLRGSAVYCFRSGALSSAFAFFGIDLKNPGRAIIVKRYRELARKYHPDLHGGDDSLMKELNAHYDVLREAVPF